MSFYDRHPIFSWFLIGFLTAMFANFLLGSLIMMFSPIIGALVGRGKHRR